MRPAWFVMAAVLVPTFLVAAEDEAGRKLEVVAPKDDGVIATGINSRGAIVGFEWVEEKDHPGVIAEVPFFYVRGKAMIHLPILRGYTATFPAAVSDDGTVVGRSSKPAPPGVRVPLRNQAFLWDDKLGIRGLGALKDDSASFACGITRDGRRISGFSVGDNRIRACVWDRDGEHWNGTPMPHEFRLGSNVVAISDDGKSLAAVDGVVPCVWSQSPSGDWRREVIGAGGALIPRAVNNAGTVAGLRHTGDGLTHAVVWTRQEGLKQLEKPAGYVRSEATAVNNAGTVVGMVDGPNGSKVGPNAFVYEKGRLRLIVEGGPNFASGTAINDARQVAGVLEKSEDEAREEVEGAGKAKP